MQACLAGYLTSHLITHWMWCSGFTHSCAGFCCLSTNLGSGIYCMPHIPNTFYWAYSVMSQTEIVTSYLIAINADKVWDSKVRSFISSRGCDSMRSCLPLVHRTEELWDTYCSIHCMYMYIPAYLLQSSICLKVMSL